MNNAIRRNGILVFLTVIFMMMLLFAKNSFTAKAAEAPYYVPVKYMNQYIPSPSQSNEEGMNTADVVVSLSTDTLQKGSVITLTGIPTDCINFQANDSYTVVFTEADGTSKTYGGWYNGESYDNGTLSYTVQSDSPSLSISFGEWHMKDASGMDASCVINADGSIENK